jgi:hypothetical protein
LSSVKTKRAARAQASPVADVPAALACAPKRVGRPRRPAEPRNPEPHERQEFADRLQAIVAALETGDLANDVRLFLQKMLRRHDLLRSVDAKRFHAKGEEEVTLLLRTVFESSNGAAALTVPILRAVSNCMEPRYVDHGLAWIEFFDSVRLVELLDQIRALDFCAEGDLETHLRAAIWRRLVRRFCPPKIAAPKKPPARPKMVRPPGVSEGSWQTVLALRKPKKKQLLTAA